MVDYNNKSLDYKNGIWPFLLTLNILSKRHNGRCWVWRRYRRLRWDSCRLEYLLLSKPIHCRCGHFVAIGTHTTGLWFLFLSLKNGPALSVLPSIVSACPFGMIRATLGIVVLWLSSVVLVFFFYLVCTCDYGPKHETKNDVNSRHDNNETKQNSGIELSSFLDFDSWLA